MTEIMGKRSMFTEDMADVIRAASEPRTVSGASHVTARAKALADRVIALLPDDGREALACISLIHANVAVSVGCPDDQALAAFKIALKQMRGPGGPS